MAGPEKQLRRKKILIVDDQEKIRFLVATTLSFGEHEILEAGDAREAIEIVRREQPDLIIMDIMMPGDIDGLQATRMLKSDPKTRRCPILILTAKGWESDRLKGLEAGADDYFAKPFRPMDLMKKVDEILSEKA